MINLILLLHLSIIFAILYHNYNKYGIDITNPMYYYLLAYCGIYIMQTYGLKDNLVYFFGEDLIVWSQLLAISGLAAFYAGFNSRTALSVATRIPVPNNDWKPNSLINLGLFWILLGIIGQIIFIQRSGGYEVYFSAPRGLGAYKENTAYLYLLKWVIVPGIIISFVAIARTAVPEWKKWLAYLVALAFFGFQVISAQRSGIIMVGILLIVSYYLPRSRKIPFYILVPSFIIIFYLISFICMFRTEMYVGSSFSGVRKHFESSLEAQTNDILIGLIGAGGDSRDLGREAAMYINYLRVVPEKVDYAFGCYYTNYLIEWIPKLIWPDRPFLFQADWLQLEKAMGTNMTGPVSTILGEYYYNFGIPGIIIGCFLTGLLLGILYQWHRLLPNNGGVLIVFLALFQIGGLWVVCHGILGEFDRLLPFTGIPVATALWWINRWEKSRAPYRSFRPGQKLKVRVMGPHAR